MDVSIYYKSTTCIGNSAQRNISTNTDTHCSTCGEASIMTYPTTPIELTTRERQVLALYAQGIRQQQIADMLTISRHTVVSALDRAQSRLYLKDRWALRDYAKRNGLDKVESEVNA